MKASEAEDAWVNALDRLEEAWRLESGSVPALRVYMRLGALQNTLGKTKEAKVGGTRCFWPIVFAPRRIERFTEDSPMC